MFEFVSFLAFGGIVSMMTVAKVMFVVFGILAAFALCLEIVDYVHEQEVETISKTDVVKTKFSWGGITMSSWSMAFEIEIGAEELAIPMQSKVLTPFWGITLGIEKNKDGVYVNPLNKSRWQALGEALIA